MTEKSAPSPTPELTFSQHEASNERIIHLYNEIFDGVEMINGIPVLNMDKLEKILSANGFTEALTENR